jgi:hypothetical protein
MEHSTCRECCLCHPWVILDIWTWRPACATLERQEFGKVRAGATDVQTWGHTGHVQGCFLFLTPPYPLA